MFWLWKFLNCGWLEVLLVLEKENFTFKLLPHVFSTFSTAFNKKTKNKFRDSLFIFGNCCTIIQLYLNCPTVAAMGPVLKCKRTYIIVLYIQILLGCHSYTFCQNISSIVSLAATVSSLNHS